MSPGELRPTLIVFDLDGVLVDSTPCHDLAYRRLWAECGVEAPDYEVLAGRTTLDVVTEHTRHLAPGADQVRRWVALKQANVLRCLEERDIAFSDALPLLRGLREEGRDMAVATGASRARARLVLERMGVESWFRGVVTADDVRAGKPDPQIFSKAIEVAGATPSQTLVVEDSPSGVAAALAAGGRVVSVRTGVRVEHPNFVSAYGDLTELASALGVGAA